jgi:hypothetical protein
MSSKIGEMAPGKGCHHAVTRSDGHDATLLSALSVSWTWNPVSRRT